MSKRIRIRLALATFTVALCVAGIAFAQLGGIPSTANPVPTTTLAPPSSSATVPATAGSLSAVPSNSLPTTASPPQPASTLPPAAAVAPLAPSSVTPVAPPVASPPPASVPATQPLAGISKTTTTTPPPSPATPTVTPLSPTGAKVPTTLTSNFPAGASSPATPPPTASASAPAATSARVMEIRNSVQVSKGAGTLPNDHGQVWREYDISPYTGRFKDAKQPEQAIIDWVLRETGTEAWFTQPLGVLNADRSTLRVYHTPEMQERVRDLVERFFATAVTEQTLVVRVITLNSPGWRNKALPLLKPIDVKSAGIDGWLLSREDSAVLMADLRRRADFREQGAPMLQTVNGQEELIARTRPRMYPKTIRLRPDVWPGFETITGQIDEGFQLQISPLPSIDGQQMEVALKCNIDQVERFVPVGFDVPIAGQTQKAEVQVPQLVSWRLHERLRWPSDQILLLSCGVVASPGPEAARLFSFIRPLDGSSRADALLMIEVKEGPASAHVTAPASPAAQPSHILPIQPLPMQQTPATATRPSVTPWRF